LAPGDDQQVVVLTIPVPAAADPRALAVVARFTPATGGSMRTLGEGSFHLEGTGAARVAQGRIALGPGDYQLELAVLDGVSASTGIARLELKLDASRDRFRLSDVTLAREVEPLPF